MLIESWRTDERYKVQVVGVLETLINAAIKVNVEVLERFSVARASSLERSSERISAQPLYRNT